LHNEVHVQELDLGTFCATLRTHLSHREHVEVSGVSKHHLPSSHSTVENQHHSRTVQVQIALHPPTKKSTRRQIGTLHPIHHQHALLPQETPPRQRPFKSLRQQIPCRPPRNTTVHAARSRASNGSPPHKSHIVNTHTAPPSITNVPRRSKTLGGQRPRDRPRAECGAGSWGLRAQRGANAAETDGVGTAAAVYECESGATWRAAR
jgi:hypothetical protein